MPQKTHYLRGKGTGTKLWLHLKAVVEGRDIWASQFSLLQMATDTKIREYSNSWKDYPRKSSWVCKGAKFRKVSSIRWLVSLMESSVQYFVQGSIWRIKISHSWDDSCFERKCSIGKYSEVRLTGMAAVSATGEKLPMFVIGKSVKPRCFKHVKSLPCRYRAQPKGWMSSFLFDEWVKELDKKFEKENRKNCSYCW